jgi:hypothetical protein
VDELVHIIAFEVEGGYNACWAIYRTIKEGRIALQATLIDAEIWRLTRTVTTHKRKETASESFQRIGILNH